MGLIQTAKGLAQSDVVKAWLPSRKVIAGAVGSAATTGAVALLTKGKGRRYGLKRRDASKLVAAVSSAIPIVIAYATSNKAEPVAPAQAR